jgi:hypothetical protein
MYKIRLKNVKMWALETAGFNDVYKLSSLAKFYGYLSLNIPDVTRGCTSNSSAGLSLPDSDSGSTFAAKHQRKWYSVAPRDIGAAAGRNPFPARGSAEADDPWPIRSGCI